MNAKEYLSQAYFLDRKINYKLRQTVSLRERAKKGTGTMYAQRVSGTDKHSPMEDAITNLIDLEHEINSDIDKLVDLKREMITVINTVNQSVYRLLLELRYLRYKSWEEIANQMRYSLQTIHCVHVEALTAVKLDIIQRARSEAAG